MRENLYYFRVGKWKENNMEFWKLEAVGEMEDYFESLEKKYVF